MDVADRLRQVRLEKKIPQQAIGDLLEVDESHISNVERNKRGMPLSKVQRWADYLGLRLQVVPKNAAAPEEVSSLQPELLALVLRIVRLLPRLHRLHRETYLNFVDQVETLERRYSESSEIDSPSSHEIRAKSS